MSMTLSQKLATAVVLAQGIFFAAWAIYEHGELQDGRAIIVKPVPVDPRDPMRGQYFTLGYEFSTLRKDLFFADLARAKPGAAVYAVLKKDGELYTLQNFLVDLPAGYAGGDIVIAGRIDRCSGDFMKEGMCFASYGIEKYFVTEGTKDPDLSKTTVRLRIDADRTARIETLLVDGKPYP